MNLSPVVRLKKLDIIVVPRADILAGSKRKGRIQVTCHTDTKDVPLLDAPNDMSLADIDLEIASMMELRHGHGEIRKGKLITKTVSREMANNWKRLADSLNIEEEKVDEIDTNEESRYSKAKQCVEVWKSRFPRKRRNTIDVEAKFPKLNLNEKVKEFFEAMKKTQERHENEIMNETVEWEKLKELLDENVTSKVEAKLKEQMKWEEGKCEEFDEDQRKCIEERLFMRVITTDMADNWKTLAERLNIGKKDIQAIDKKYFYDHTKAKKCIEKHDFRGESSFCETSDWTDFKQYLDQDVIDKIDALIQEQRITLFLSKDMAETWKTLAQMLNIEEEEIDEINSKYMMDQSKAGGCIDIWKRRLPGEKFDWGELQRVLDGEIISKVDAKLQEWDTPPCKKRKVVKKSSKPSNVSSKCLYG